MTNTVYHMTGTGTEFFGGEIGMETTFAELQELAAGDPNGGVLDDRGNCVVYTSRGIEYVVAVAELGEAE
jgi:hypothetical protein